MRFTLAGALLLIDATYVSAFPAIAVEHAARLIKDPNSPLHQEQKRIFGFNPKLQYVSTTGDHKFVPPNFAAGDQRGPCPGLNAVSYTTSRFSTNVTTDSTITGSEPWIYSTQWRRKHRGLYQGHQRRLRNGTRPGRLPRCLRCSNGW